MRELVLYARPGCHLCVESRATIEAILKANGVVNDADEFARKALACPALPTCGLALAEAERFLPRLLDEVRQAWQAAGLRDGVPTIRVTGCPNSCARPPMPPARR